MSGSQQFRNARQFDLAKIADDRGNLSYLQEVDQIPFRVRRVYWIYDVPGGEIRGSHAFKETHEVIVALSGSFDVRLHDGSTETVFSLRRSYHAVLVPKLYWRTLENFSTNSLALIMASTAYNEKDYIRDFDEFRTIRKNAEQHSL